MIFGGMALLAFQAAPRAQLAPPQNVNAEPSTPRADALTTGAATAEIRGDSSTARRLADEAIRADPRDPWGYYDKGMALASLGQTDAAVAALREAERRFSPADEWARSVAIYGRAHTLSEVGRCGEARQAFGEYASRVAADDAHAATMARAYGAECRTPPGR
jgi:tetratricopeptide (TPR) repeat protein